MYAYLRSLTLHQFKSLDVTKRIVVIHPHYVQPHVFLGQLDHEINYVLFSGDHLTYAQLAEQLDSALGNATPAADSILVLDELDRAQSAAADRFLPELADQIACQRIIIFCRRIPTILLQDPELVQQVAFIPVDEDLLLWDYAYHQENGSHLLEVNAFGKGQVTLNGKTYDRWDGVLPRSLFFYLVDRGMVTRSEIFETFWPELPTREATNVFHVTKRKISEVMGIDLTTYWSGYYHIASNINLSYDSVHFTELVQRSAVSPAEEAIELLNRATFLYRGDFLCETDMDWAVKRRYELKAEYGEALGNLARAYEEIGRMETALGLYLRALAFDGPGEEVLYGAVHLYTLLNQHEEACAVHQRFQRHSSPRIEQVINNAGIVD